MELYVQKHCPNYMYVSELTQEVENFILLRKV